MTSNGDDFTNEQLQEMFSDCLANNMSSTSVKVEQYSGHPSRDILPFINDYECTANAKKWSKDVKSRKLPLGLRDSAKDWYEIYVKDKQNSWDEIVESLKDHFLPANYKSYLREEIRKRFQMPNESVTNYVFAKQKLCKRLNSHTAESDIIDFVTDGVEPEIANQIVVHSPGTIEDILNAAKQIEKGIKFANERMPKNYRNINASSFALS